MRAFLMVVTMWCAACDPPGTQPIERWPHHRARTDELAKQIEAEQKLLAELSTKVAELTAQLAADRAQIASLASKLDAQGKPPTTP